MLHHIFRRYVITAAHCQHKAIRRKQIQQVVLGEWDLEHDPDCEPNCANSPFLKVQKFEITANDVTVHEEWDLSRVADNGNDIALIRLPRLAITVNEEFDQIVAPACIAWDRTIQVPTDAHIVSGWGRTNNDAYDRGDIRVSGAHSAKLKKLEVPIIPLDRCTTEWPIFKDLTQKQICAGGILGMCSVFYWS